MHNVSNTIMNGLGTEGKWYEFNFDYKNIDRHLVMGGIQTASAARWVTCTAVVKYVNLGNDSCICNKNSGFKNLQPEIFDMFKMFAVTAG